MLQVFHIIAGLKVGGAEMTLYRLISKNKETKYCHTVISLTNGGVIKDLLKEENIEVVVFDFQKNSIKKFWKLFLYMKTKKPDIVCAWMYHANVIGGVAAYLAGVKNIIWGLRTTDVKTGSNFFTKIIRGLGSGLSYFIPKIIVCPAKSVSISHSRIGYSKNKLIVIHNGYDSEKIKFNSEKRDLFRENLGLKSDQIVIGSLGRFSKAKDQKNYITAVAGISRSKENVRFLMVGKELTNNNIELTKWAKELDIQDKLILYGECSDVSMCLSSMDIYCLHSRREGFPNALCEAMLVGLPCVSTDVGDVEVVLKNVGIIVPKEDSVALKHGLEKLLALTPDERYKIGQEARKRISNNFSLAKARERYEEVYKKILMDYKN